jgi:hypothetical protein
LFAEVPGVQFVHQQVPEWILTILWISAGVFALRGAVTKRDEDVANGFFVLAFMPAFYAGSYLWAGITTPDLFAIGYALALWTPISLIVYTAATDERPKPGDPDYDPAELS